MDAVRSKREYLAAALFLAALAAGAFLWIWGLLAPEDSYGGMVPASKAAMLAEVSASPSAGRTAPRRLAQAETVSPAPLPDQIESLSLWAQSGLPDALDRSHIFIQLYGGVQRLLGRRILDDVDEQYTVYKLSDGALTFVNPEADPNIADRADALLDFIALMEEEGRPVLYLQAPQKIRGDGADSLPSGVTDQGNALADELLSLLEEGGADTLDFRETLAEDGQSWTSYFFATDHHWTPSAAFLCWQELAGVLETDYGFTISPEYVDRESFTVTEWDGVFLGSQGKRTGSLYAGSDCLELWSPDFPNLFTYLIPIQLQKRMGSFDRSLLFPERLEEADPFQANPYTYYSGGDYPFARITNELDPDGPKVLILRDSFGCVFTPFLALSCGELTTFDLRYFHDDFLTYVDWIDPDLILLLYSPGSLGKDECFAFQSSSPAD